MASKLRDPKSLQANSNTLILQMNDSRIRMSLVQNNKLIHFDNPPNGKPRKGKVFTVPPYVLLLTGKIFLFGESTLGIYNKLKSSHRATDDCWEHVRFWNLGKLINEQNALEKQGAVAFNDWKFDQTTLELLLACFINYLIILVQNSEWEGLSIHKPLKINQLLFCVPIRYSSVARQRLKDAGGILGLETRVVSEVIPAFYLYLLYLLEPKNDHHRRPHKTLMLSENSDLVDVAFFIPTSTKIRMVTKIGEEEEEQRVTERWRTFDPALECPNPILSEETKQASRIRTLLWKFQNDLPPLLNDYFHNSPKNLFIFCMDPKWQEIMEVESRSQFTPNGNLFPDISKRWDPSWEPFSLEQMYGEGVEDVTPHNLYWSEFVMGDPTSKRFVEPTGNLLKVKFKYPVSFIVIHEGKKMDNRFIIGNLRIPIFLYFRYSEIELHMRWNKQEGIYTFDKVYGYSCEEECKKLLKAPVDYYWETGSLSEKEKLRLAKVTKEIEEYGIEFQVQRSRLVDKCNDLKQKLRLAELRRVKIFEKKLRNSKNPETELYEDSELEQIKQTVRQVQQIQNTLSGLDALSLDYEETESQLEELGKSVK